MTEEERELMSLEAQAKTEAEELTLLAAFASTNGRAIYSIGLETETIGVAFPLATAQDKVAAALRRRAVAWREQAGTLRAMRLKLRRERLARQEQAWRPRVPHRAEAIAN